MRVTKRIRRITGDGFKSFSTSQDVEPLTLLCGPNGSGKTARLQAATYAITGRTGIGATADATFRMSSNGVLGAGVTIEGPDGVATFVRSLTRDQRKKALTQDIEVTGQESLGIAEANAEIARLCGRFVAPFDLDAFVGLTPDKRRSYVLDLCAKHVRGASPASLLDAVSLAVLAARIGDGAVQLYVRAQYNKSVSDLTDDELKAVSESLWPQADATYRDAWLMLCAELQAHCRSATEFTEALAALLEHARVRKNESKAARNEAQAASRRLSDDKAQIEVVSETVAELKTDLDSLVTKHADLREQLGRCDGHSEAVRQVVLSIEAIQKQIAEATKARDASRERLVDARSALGEVPSLEARLAKQKAKTDPRPALAANKKRLAELAEIKRRSLVAAESARNTAGETIARLIGDPWLTALNIAARIHDDLRFGAVAELVEHVKRQAKESEQEMCDAHRMELAAVEDIARTKAAFDTAWGDFNKAAAEYETASVEWSTRDGEVRQLESNIASLKAAAATAETRLDTDERILNNYCKALLELEDRKYKLAQMPTGDAELIQKQLDANEAERANVHARLKARERYAALETELATCIAAAEREGVQHEVAKAAEQAIAEQRERIMASLIEPLADRVQAFLDVAAPGRTFYCDLQNDKGRPAFAMGWIANDRKVTLETLSSGESGVFMAALAFAITDVNDAPLRVLMLECDSLDHANLTRTLEALRALSVGLGNVIVATSRTLEGVDKSLLAQSGWKVVELV